MKLPPVTKSLRFRLSGFTSAVVFGLGGLALGAVYLAVLWRLRSSTMRTVVVTGQPVRVGGQTYVVPQLAEQEMRTLESIFREYLLNQVAFVTVVVLVGLFLMSLLVSWMIAGRALRPVRRITEVAEEIEATDLSRRIGPVSADDELTRLGATFDSMLDRLDVAFQGQKSFLAQTSHDLRTPLAVIRSNLDVTLADPAASVDDWRAAAEVIGRSADSMAAMVEGLLATARLDMESSAFVKIDLAELASRVAGDNQARAARLGLSIDTRLSAVEVLGDPAAIERAVANLLENALRVAPSGSAVVVAAGLLEDCPYLAVADRGPGFEVQSEDDGRNGRRGLGLSIVRGIVDAHGGSVSVADRDGGGSTVVLWLPQQAKPVPGALPAF